MLRTLCTWKVLLLNAAARSESDGQKAESLERPNDPTAPTGASSAVCEDGKCQMCAEKHTGDASSIECAVVYCASCHQNLCSTCACSPEHKKYVGELHRLVPLEMDAPLRRGEYCCKHKDSKVQLYCFNCDRNLCSECASAAEHMEHNCRKIDRVAEIIRPVVSSNVQQVCSELELTRTKAALLDVQREELCSRVATQKQAIEKTADELRRLIETDVKKLTAELESIALRPFKELEAGSRKLAEKLRTLEEIKTIADDMKTDWQLTTGSENLVAKFNRAMCAPRYELCNVKMPSFRFQFQPSNISERIFVGRIETSQTGVMSSDNAAEDVSTPSTHDEKFKVFFSRCAFSQHWICGFDIDGVHYATALQYMVHQKALLLGKYDIADMVMATGDYQVWEKMLAQSESCDADRVKWRTYCRSVVKKGNLAKFEQKRYARVELLATAGKTLVYADMLDSVLGIGIKFSSPIVTDRSRWRGENLLGTVLAEIRDEMLAKIAGRTYSWQVGDVCKVLLGRNYGGSIRAVIKSIDAVHHTCLVSTVDDNIENYFHLSTLEVDDNTDNAETVPDGAGSAENESEKFTFIFQMDSPFSRWYVCKFVVDGIEYNCVEQHTMHQKALLFKDYDMAVEIMQVKTVAQLKELGSRVAGYVDHKWRQYQTDIFKTGNTAKFTQNPDLLRKLLATAGTTIAMTGPWDSFLGIGLAVGDKLARCRKAWPGQNLFGNCLTEIREEMLRRMKDGTHTEQLLMSDYAEPEANEPTGPAAEAQPEPAQRTEDDAPEGYTLFCGVESPFSQWFPAIFEKDGITFVSAMQYSLYQKAVFFDDPVSAQEILTETDLSAQKTIASNIKNFDETRWKTVRRNIAKTGILEKFRQNDDLRRELFATAHTVLVEATDHDHVWGIGLAQDDPLSWRRRTWNGENQLGQILTEVRDELMLQRWPAAGAMSQRTDAGVSYRAFTLPQSPFHMHRRCPIVFNDQTFVSAGQCLLHQEALFLGNAQLAGSILSATTVDELNEIAANLVLTADQQLQWRDKLRKLLKEICQAKLDQNADVMQKLLETGSDILVYAADEPPLGIDTSCQCADDNWLGRILMILRDKLLESTDFYNLERARARLPDDRRASSPAGGRLGSRTSDTRIADGCRPSPGPYPPLRMEGSLSDEALLPKNAIVFSRPDSPFHMWYRSSVAIDDNVYWCAGQAFLHQAAELFGDSELARKILDDGEERDYYMFWKKCANYDLNTWIHFCLSDRLEKINVAKFEQSVYLRQTLLATNDAKLVYASRNDRQLGTGCDDREDTFKRPNLWRGKNLLGKTLAKIRSSLKNFPE